MLKVDVCIDSNMKFSDLELRKILIQVTFSAASVVLLLTFSFD